MKKTLAAVLAAAMALSTATVAFADDFDMDEELIDLRNWSSSDNVRGTFPYGKDFTRLINSVEVEDIGTINGYDLAEWVDQGLVNVSVIVTEGSAKLAGKPSIEIRKVNNTYQTSETAYTWNCTIRDYKNKVIVRKGSSVGDIPVFDANGTWGFVSDYGTFGGNMTITADSDGDPIYTINDDVIELMKKSKDNTNNRNYAGMLAQILAGGAVSENSNLKDESVKLGNLLRMKLKVADTYGVDDTTVGMKLRITVRKSFTDDNGINHIKGNTYTSDEFKYKAVYYELSNYYEDMQLTLEEVDKRYVKLDASDLYDQIGADDFSISFEDTARFDAKLSASQKDVNLFYDVDEVTAVTDAYPSVDFEFITFRGKPSFINSGTMTFNAVGGKNTQVYTYDGDALTPLDGSYSSTYDTVTVKGIKKLGTFVVASEILEVEEEPEEPAEPVDSAPSVEDNDKNDDEGGNPNTGAC